MTSEIIQLIQEQEPQIIEDDIFADEDSSQYLSFVVGEEEFSVNILKVQEIRAWEHTTFLPNSPSYIKGVLNLRGTIVPVMDLRIRFGFKNPEYKPTTAVIILKTVDAERERLMGCIVDAVSDVINVAENDISEKPDFGSSIDSEFIDGIMTVNNSPVTLLNLDALLNLELIAHPFTAQKVSNG
ncbi:purine-binding chemotaxis protein CheW [Aliikangiella marina]|uniref:Chemotaxis protein CheW n=1 Tax=Aliikangiella marina TaxID=1712262 RepID=A0A545TDN8_9GAMM|nr:chemotaxis protein CheW [Aliikangiella marina]TQV75338.1 purine-binding chemotaxis protein CheW [Aliikangiella marina]